MLHLLLLADDPGWWQNPIIWWIPALILLFYLFILKPARRQEQQRQLLLNSLKKNDKVLTTAGIYGQVVSVSDTDDEVVVKVDENVRLRMVKAAIARNLSGEEVLKQQAAQKAAPSTNTTTPASS